MTLWAAAAFLTRRGRDKARVLASESLLYLINSLENYGVTITSKRI